MKQSHQVLFIFNKKCIDIYPFRFITWAVSIPQFISCYFTISYPEQLTLSIQVCSLLPWTLVCVLRTHIWQLHMVHKPTLVAHLQASATVWSHFMLDFDEHNLLYVVHGKIMIPHIISLRKSTHQLSYHTSCAWRLQGPYNDLLKSKRKVKRWAWIIISSCEWKTFLNSYSQLPVSPVSLYTSWECCTFMSLLNPKSPTFRWSALELTRRTFLETHHTHILPWKLRREAGNLPGSSFRYIKIIHTNFQHVFCVIQSEAENLDVLRNSSTLLTP